MSRIDSPAQRLEPEPLPDNLCSVQPGSGFCYSLELAWGRQRLVSADVSPGAGRAKAARQVPTRLHPVSIPAT